MTENTYHNLKPLKDALQQMGFATMEQLYNHVSQFGPSERIQMLDKENDEFKKILLTNAIRYLGMGANGRGI